MKKSYIGLLVLGLCVATYLLLTPTAENTVKKPGSGMGMKKASVPVITATVSEQSLAQSLTLIGKLEAERSVTIAPQVAGKIDAIAVRSNQEVKAGDLLLVLEESKAKAAVMEAESYLADERRKLGEYEKLIDRNAITQTEIDAQRASVSIAEARLASARAELSYHHLRAPFSGTVGLVDFSKGKLVSQGTELLSLDDLSLLRLDLQVPESYLSQLSVGMQVQGSSSAWNGQLFQGEVVAIDPRVNPDTLNVRVRVEFNNPNKQLRPGMMLSATLTFPPLHQAVVPVQALEYSGTKRYVYRIDENNIAHRTEVHLGARVEHLVLITDGVSLGDRIVVQGLVNIRDGASVKPLTAEAVQQTGELH